LKAAKLKHFAVFCSTNFVIISVAWQSRRYCISANALASVSSTGLLSRRLRTSVPYNDKEKM